jgi:hypothetical protein
MNGGLFTDFDVQPLAAMPASVERTRRNGRFVYRSDQAASLRIGRGGPLLTLESLNGDVRVLRGQR